MQWHILADLIRLLNAYTVCVRCGKRPQPLVWFHRLLISTVTLADLDAKDENF
jgi:hypothetical protein